MSPFDIVNYNRTYKQLEKFWIFCILVAGKNSDWAANKVEELLAKCPRNQRPLEFLTKNRGLNRLQNLLGKYNTGQYKRISLALKQSTKVDLRKATIEDLEQIYGVGPKTARFFILFSRRNIECAVLDTHILKWLHQKGVKNVPKTTPKSGKMYEELSKQTIRLIKKYYPRMNFAEADLFIWATQSGRLLSGN